VFGLDLNEASFLKLTDDILLNHLKKQVDGSIVTCVDSFNLFFELKFQHYDDPAQSVHEIFAQSRRILSMNSLAE
jgi:hypothetical protein